MTTSYRSLTLLSVSVFALLAYNFLGAAWTPAPANPPNENVAAPINVSSTTQTKTGRLELQWNSWSTTTGKVMFRTNGNAVGNIFAAGSQMWSPEYCDAVGENCSSATDIFNVVNNFSTTTGLQLGDDGFPALSRTRFNQLCASVSPGWNNPHVGGFGNPTLTDLGIHNGMIVLEYQGTRRIRTGCNSYEQQVCTVAYDGSDFLLVGGTPGSGEYDCASGGSGGSL